MCIEVYTPYILSYAKVALLCYNTNLTGSTQWSLQGTVMMVTFRDNKNTYISTVTINQLVFL